MQSTKLQTQTGLKNPFVTSRSCHESFTAEYKQYRMNLEYNLQMLGRKFPNETPSKLKDLLQQFDNDAEMVTDILMETADKHDRNQMVGERIVFRRNSDLDEENKLLKRAIARLYRRIIEQEKELETVKGLHERVRKDNEDLRMQNRLLLDREFTRNCFDEERDVY